MEDLTDKYLSQVCYQVDCNQDERGPFYFHTVQLREVRRVTCIHCSNFDRGIVGKQPHKKRSRGIYLTLKTSLSQCINYRWSFLSLVGNLEKKKTLFMAMQRGKNWEKEGFQLSGRLKK